MNSKYDETGKQQIIDRYLASGESVSVLSIETGIPRSTLYAWIKHYHETQANGKVEASYCG